eukprot:1185832-Alexandrium_andersonii.AAC.1
MSASLVGSEMCIRDRNCLRRHLRQAAATAAAGSSQGSWRHTGRRRQAAVSYTHLTLPTICSV